MVGNGRPKCVARQRRVLPAVAMLLSVVGTARAGDAPLFNDAHFHLTNYVQVGPPIREFLDHTMGTKVGRVALFGIPLQQTWSYENSGDYAPTYYLQSDAPPYYYSFTDAFIAMACRSLTKEQQARFDPMITGFNLVERADARHEREGLPDQLRPALRRGPHQGVDVGAGQPPLTRTDRKGTAR